MTKTTAFAKALWRLNLEGMPLRAICSFCELSEDEALMIIEWGARLTAIDHTKQQLDKLCGRSLYDIMERAGMDLEIDYTGD